MSIFRKMVRLRLVHPAVQPTRSDPATLPPKAIADSKAYSDDGAVGSNPTGVLANLDTGSRISGKLHFAAFVRIDGQVDGKINSEDLLVVGESAVVAASIKARSVVISGEVNGDIVATHRIEIRAPAHVRGNLSSPTLVIHAGALFEGLCAMRPEAREDRKIAPVPRSA
jgi:cytoskeletal protein CcmA (bactofilin family)